MDGHAQKELPRLAESYPRSAISVDVLQRDLMEKEQDKVTSACKKELCVSFSER